MRILRLKDRKCPCKAPQPCRSGSDPFVLGSGKRLFGTGAVPAALKLASTHTTSTGVLISTHQRVGRPSYGSFPLDG